MTTNGCRDEYMHLVCTCVQVLMLLCGLLGVDCYVWAAVSRPPDLTVYGRVCSGSNRARMETLSESY